MPAKKPYLLLSVCCLLHVCFSKSVAQNNASSAQSSVQVFLLKDSIELEEAQFGFNNCTLLYTGPSGINAEVKTEAPEAVSVVSPLTVSYYQLLPNQQQVLPLRFIFYNNKTVSWQAVTVTVRIKETGEAIEKKFWLRTKAFSKWRCGLPQPDLLVQATEAKINFGVMLQNLGNTAEDYSLRFASELPVEADKKFGHIQLAPMESRLLEIPVLLAGMQRSALGYTVTVQIKNSRGEEKVLLQKIRVISSQYAGERPAWLKAPLTLEAGAQKNGYGATVFTAALNGRIAAGEGKALFLSTQLTNLSQRFWFNNQAVVQYESNNLRLKAGSMTAYRHFIINGTGGDAFLRLKKSSFEASAIKSSLGNTRQAEAKYNYDATKDVSFSTDLVAHDDDDRKVVSRIFVNKLSWRLSSSTSLSVEGGTGSEKVQTAKGDTTLQGSTGGYQLETGWKGVRLSSQVTLYSKNFPGLNKGFQFHNHELAYSFRPFLLSAFFQTAKKVFTATDDSLFRSLLNIEQKEWGVKTGMQTGKLLLSLSAGLYQQKGDSLNAVVERMKKASATVLWNIRPGFTFSLISSAGFVSVPQRPDIRPFWAFTNYGSLQHHAWGLNFQVNNGPFYYFEVKDYLQTPRPFQRIQVSPFYEVQTKGRTLYDRLQFTYNRERPGSADNCFLLNQLVLSSPSCKADVSLLTNLSLRNSRNSFAGISVRKQLALPVWKTGDSYSFTLLLYKDKNNNNQYEKGLDEVIPQAVVMVNESAVQTAADGEVMIKNVGKEALHLYFGTIARLRGWIPKGGLKQTIIPTKEEKKLFIPFKQSRTVTGALQFYFDDKSMQRMEPGNIRLTATDESGNTFSTLTDDGGKFFFNLPAGQYIVSLNTAAFDEQFKPTETSQTADLKNNDTIDLRFDVRQKRRQMNIRKVNGE